MVPDIVYVNVNDSVDSTSASSYIRTVMGFKPVAPLENTCCVDGVLKFPLVVKSKSTPRIAVLPAATE